MGPIRLSDDQIRLTCISRGVTARIRVGVGGEAALIGVWSWTMIEEGGMARMDRTGSDAGGPSRLSRMKEQEWVETAGKPGVDLSVVCAKTDGRKGGMSWKGGCNVLEEGEGERG